ncbi:MAG TPA: cation:proton antiporter [Euryarchaeota archaeon]|nr:cation:proton antiporter [Euryarchaeota archaeon]
MGFGLIFVYENYFVVNENWLIHALFMSAAMVATCVGITARVLTDLNVIDTVESKIIVGAAVVDDILAMIVLAIVAGVAGARMGGGTLDTVNILASIGIAILFVAMILYLCIHGIPKVKEMHAKRNGVCDVRCQERDWPISYNPFPLAVLVCLGLSAMAMFLGLAAIIGAFLAGMLFGEFAGNKVEKEFKGINSFLVPFFFVYVGMRVQTAGIIEIVPLMILTIVLAILGKYVAGYLGVVLTSDSLGKRAGNIVGVGMSPRGEVGIIVAAIGLTTGAISGSMYTVVVFMSIATALIAPPWLASAFAKKYPQAREPPSKR